VGMEFSYDFGVLSVVKNQPFRFGWPATIRPIQTSWLDQGLATLASVVGKEGKWATSLQKT